MVQAATNYKTHKTIYKLHDYYEYLLLRANDEYDRMQTSYQPQPPGSCNKNGQFLLKTELNAHETRIEEHMRDRLYARISETQVSRHERTLVRRLGPLRKAPSSSWQVLHYRLAS